MSAAENLHGDQFAHLWGSGDLDRLFTMERPKSVVPWAMAGRSKVRHDYDKERVYRAIEGHAPVVPFDPRDVKATQPMITRAGVSYYMGDEYRQTGRTYADRDQAGNRFPVVYSRERTPGGEVDHLLLSGHHRAASSLLRGEQFEARHVEGPWGPPRRR